jgi:hypothetical protein
MAIDEVVAARILVKCARHCCICRRFAPLHLQVHHIKQRSEGGSDDEDNLIAICLTCHCDVHTQTLFTRRFTEQELKGHRDAVYALVSQGKLPSSDVPGAVAGAAAEVAARSAATRIEEKISLSPRAVEILVNAGTAAGHAQGLVEVTLYQIQMGAKIIKFPDQRTGASYREAFQTLLNHDVFDQTEQHTILYLNAKGFRWVDQLLALGAAKHLSQ